MKKQNTLVSILIINFNNAKLLKRSIRSCINQTYKNIEILVYDDKSTDNSFEILKSFKKNNKIRFFLNSNKKKFSPALDAMNGYIHLFKKSKGSIICFLDSDDYFKKNKVLKVKNSFKSKNFKFIQNLPLIKNKKKFKLGKNKNNPLSYWPYFAPESCISFKRDLMLNFLKVNKSYLNKFPDIWLGFRLGVYAFFKIKKFHTINKSLTIYESLGESKKYSRFNKNWMRRRKDSFEYLKKITNNKKILKGNFDYIITNFLTKIYK